MDRSSRPRSHYELKKAIRNPDFMGYVEHGAWQLENTHPLQAQKLATYNATELTLENAGSWHHPCHVLGPNAIK